MKKKNIFCSCAAGGTKMSILNSVKNAAFGAAVTTILDYLEKAGVGTVRNVYNSPSYGVEDLSSTFPGFLSVFHGKNLYIGNYRFLYDDKSCII